MKVDKINKDTVELINQHGESLAINKRILEKDSFSADHFKQEVICNMTELVGILESAKDSIFKVSFRKKLSDKSVFEKLQAISYADVQKDSELNKISKQLLEGELAEIVGHLVENDCKMGRTLVIDLDAPQDSAFRQIDHRTIEFIILRNVKYTLGKKTTLAANEDKIKQLSQEQAKWDLKSLQVGNWFSEMQYYQLLEKEASKNGDFLCEVLKKDAEQYHVPEEQLLNLMNSGTLYDQEQKITRTEIVELMTEAKECILTVDFRKKVKQADIEEHLKSLKSAADLKSKNTIDTIIHGEQISISGFLVDAEGKLGRSTIIDLS